jgi:hypothetical protein
MPNKVLESCSMSSNGFSADHISSTLWIVKFTMKMHNKVKAVDHTTDFGNLLSYSEGRVILAALSNKLTK